MRDAKILKAPVPVYYCAPQARKIFCVLLGFVVFLACSEARSLPGAEIIMPVRTGTGSLHLALVPIDGRGRALKEPHRDLQRPPFHCQRTAARGQNAPPLARGQSGSHALFGGLFSCSFSRGH